MHPFTSNSLPVNLALLYLCLSLILSLFPENKVEHSPFKYDDSEINSLNSLSISSNEEAALSPVTICDIGGPLFTQGAVYERTLASNEFILNSLRSSSCIKKVFLPGGLPSVIYADYYVFYGSSIDLYVETIPDNPQIKIGVLTFDCDTSEVFCRSSPPFLQSGDGFTYVAVVSNAKTKYRLSDYSVDNPCFSSNYPTISIDCCNDVITDTLTRGSNFNQLGSATYADCYVGGREYEGGDNVYEFELSQPSRVTLTLRADGNAAHELGMFLFNYDCGLTCVNFAEIPDNEQRVTMRNILLAPGIYHVVVDTDLPKGLLPSNVPYTLNYESRRDSSYLAYQLSSPLTCPVLTNAVHGLMIDGNAPELGLGDRLGFYYDKGMGMLGINQQRFWDGTATGVQLYLDDPAVTEKCSYELEEPLKIKVTKADDLTVWDLQASFAPGHPQVFTPGSQSFISELEIDSSAANSKLYHSPGGMVIVPPSKTVINFTVLSANENSWWIENSLESWIPAPSSFVYPNVHANNENFDITIQQNFQNESRSDTIRFLGVDGSLRTTILIQRPTANGVALTVMKDKRDISCFGANDGLICITPSGGTAPFFYDWSNSAESAKIIGLSPGTYTVTVTDILGLSTTATAQITQPAALIIDSISVEDSAPGVNDGMATAHPSGGTPNYSFEWNTGQTTQSISMLAAGAYTVTITDANECTVSESTLVEVIDCSGLSGAIAKSDVTCYADDDGSAWVIPENGEGPYSYLWSDGQTDSLLTRLPAADYSVTVTDGNNCSIVFSINISEPDSISIQEDITHTSNGQNNGAIDLIIEGGTGPYFVTWTLNGMTFPATGPNIDQLAAGIYRALVTDEKGCTNRIEITINFSTAIRTLFTDESIKVLPNPTGGKVRVILELSFRNSSLGLSDLLGNPLDIDISEIRKNQIYEVNFGDIPSGVYLLNVTTKMSRASKRILLMR